MIKICFFLIFFPIIAKSMEETPFDIQYPLKGDFKETHQKLFDINHFCQLLFEKKILKLWVEFSSERFISYMDFMANNLRKNYPYKVELLSIREPMEEENQYIRTYFSESSHQFQTKKEAILFANSLKKFIKLVYEKKYPTCEFFSSPQGEFPQFFSPNFYQLSWFENSQSLKPLDHMPLPKWNSDKKVHRIYKDCIEGYENTIKVLLLMKNRTGCIFFTIPRDILYLIIKTLYFPHTL